MNSVIKDKMKLYFLAKKLKNLAVEMDKLSKEEKRVVIERADKEERRVLKRLYDSLNDYMD